MTQEQAMARIADLQARAEEAVAGDGVLMAEARQVAAEFNLQVSLDAPDEDDWTESDYHSDEDEDEGLVIINN